MLLGLPSTAGSAIEALRKQLALHARVLRMAITVVHPRARSGDTIRVKVGVSFRRCQAMTGEGLVVDQPR